jgi:serine/threonine-protein kinase
MSGDSRVEQLLELILDSECTPEEACRDCPELLSTVRERLRKLRSIEVQVNAMFPPSDALPPHYGLPPLPLSDKLPEIPGYVVEGILGRGGVGVVYKARHLKLGRPVALKMLLAGPYASAPELMRFMREAQAVAALDHINIVQVHDVGELEGRPYYTMELVEGGSLAQRLAGAPQPAAGAATMVATLARAIHTAHQRGIVHRDLKPGNVLLTLEGTPKISDFGLARYLDREGALTLTGARVGTPSYMAPESAAGKTSEIGPQADIYSLGGILYEMLTGRPPFRGETTAETERQLLTQEPVPPSRLNAKVPRDLQTICLKCLNKDPQRRYTTAAALADDIERFQRGEPISARPAGVIERTGKWVRRRPGVAAALVGSVFVIAAAGGAALWFITDRAATTRAVQADLKEVTDAEHRSDWTGASAALGRAKARLGNRSIAYLHGEMDQDAQDLELAHLLGSAELNRFSLMEGRYSRRFDKVHANAAYTDAFRRSGIGSTGDDPGAVAARIRQSNIKAALVDALDDWALCVADPQEHRWLFQVACAADPDPNGWRDRARDPAVYNDRNALLQLTQSASSAKATVRLLVALGERLQDAGADATPFLRQVQKEYPNDFWVNTILGDAIRNGGDPAESLRYYQAALAIRPDSAVAYGNLGVALAADGRLDDAIDQFRAGIQIDKDFIHGHYSLGLALRKQGRTSEAIAELKEASRLAPDFADGQYNLGLALHDSGQLDQAIESFRMALRADPNHAYAHFNLGAALRKKGRTNEAISELSHAIRLVPDIADWHYNLGLALADSNQPDQAIESFRTALQLDPNHAYARFNLGVALWKERRIDEAIPELKEACRLAPKFADSKYILALALADDGQLDQAIESFRSVLRIDPKNADAHFNLGMALRKQGHTDEAIAEFNQAIRLNPNNADYYYNQALALRDNGQLDQAIDAFRSTLRQNPNHADALYNLGVALKAKGDLEGAIASLRKATELQPGNADALYNLGVALQARGDFESAIVPLRKATELQPGNAYAYYNLGVALKAKGDFEGAIAPLRKATELQPGNAYAHYNLALALRASNRRDEAIDQLQDALEIDPKQADTHYNLAGVLRDSGQIYKAIAQYQQAVALDPNDAAAYGEMGDCLLSKGHLQDAQAALRRCLELIPPNSSERPHFAQQLEQCNSRLAAEKGLSASGPTTNPSPARAQNN